MNYALCIALCITLTFTACGGDVGSGEDPDGVKTMAAGTSYTVAIKNDGTLWAWGNNFRGQLGNGKGNQVGENVNYDEILPIPIMPDKKNWVLVSAGTSHTVAIDSDDILYTWGEGNSGKLGNGSQNNCFVPTPIDKKWKIAAAGDSHTVAIDVDDILWTWGGNAYGQLGNDTTGGSSNDPIKIRGDKKWKSVSAGPYTTIAVDMNDKLWIWGSNNHGQMGNNTGGSSGNVQNTPVMLDGEWKSVALGNSFTIAINSVGELYGWGRVDYGALGIGHFNNRKELTPVRIVEGKDWESVSAGSFHTIAKKKNGEIWGWGNNEYGQLGYPKTTLFLYYPTRIGTAADLVAVSAGINHSTALRSSGILWTWGSNESGQLGDDTRGSDDHDPAPVKWP